MNHNLRFQAQRTTNDLFFTFAAIVKSSKITLLNEELAIHRRNSLDSLSITREKSWQCCYDAVMKLKTEIINMGLYDLYKNNFINYALHFMLWNLSTLKNQSAADLFDFLLKEGFENIGIHGHESDDFTNQGEYEQYMKITTYQPGSYHLFKLEKLQIELDLTRKSLVTLQNQNAASVQSIQTGNTNIENIQNQLENLKNGIDDFNDKIYEFKNQSNDNAELAQFYQNELDGTRKSLSFRIGQFFTFIPRKIRKIVKKGK